MTRWVVQLRVEDDVALGALRGHAGRHLPGSVGGGDATWDLVSDAPPGTGATPGLQALDTVALAPLCSAHVAFDGPRVKRTLLLRVRPGAPPAATAQFEAELAAMPDYIPTIRSWALSRADHRLAPTRWTHVWEQEYETVDGLRGGYMMSPYHWAGVDRWFDPEVPASIVEPEVAHVFYAAPGPVLT
jgi:hypothetical protein